MNRNETHTAMLAIQILAVLAGLTIPHGGTGAMIANATAGILTLLALGGSRVGPREPTGHIAASELLITAGTLAVANIAGWIPAAIIRAAGLLSQMATIGRLPKDPIP